MIDILWRTPDDEDFEEVMDITRNIVVVTDVTYRISNTCYYNKNEKVLMDCGEKLIKFAFLD